MKKIYPPRGFYFSMKSGCYVNSHEIHLRHLSNHLSIGYIHLYKIGNSMETHSSLLLKYRRKGYGAKLYAKAIDWAIGNGYGAISSTSASEDAKRVWNGSYLKNRFSVKKIGKIFRARYK